MTRVGARADLDDRDDDRDDAAEHEDAEVHDRDAGRDDDLADGGADNEHGGRGPH